jgi:hypothetical protein
MVIWYVDNIADSAKVVGLCNNRWKCCWSNKTTILCNGTHHQFILLIPDNASQSRCANWQ